MNIEKTIDERFLSGNEVPVERAYITAAEWQQIKRIVWAIKPCLAILEAARPLVLSLETLKDAADELREMNED